MSSILLADNGVSSGAAGLKSSADGTGTLALQTTTASGTATTAVLIDNAQNVGVGVTPSAWSGVTAFQNKSASIAVTPNGNNMDLATNRYYNGTSDLFYQTGNYALMYEQASGSGAHRWFTSTATGTAGNAISFTQAMTLDANGALLVGTTSTANAAKVEINFNGTTTNGLVLQTTKAGLNSVYELFLNSAGATAGQISQNGTTTVAYTTSSDYRLKENVQPMTGALSVVNQLNPVTYNWKSDGSDGQGFIAHELQAVLPDCVVGEKDEVDANGNPKYQGIDTSFLVATLTAAIQEQQSLIQSLTDRLTALEGAAK